MSDKRGAPFEVWIGSAESGYGHVKVQAQYNPKELSISKSVPWSTHQDSKANLPHLEFTGAQGRELSIELFFDGLEKNEDVHQLYVSHLVTMTELINPNGSEDDKRPHKVHVVWDKMEKFFGVIKSLSTKYSMFHKDGRPARVTCNLTITEATDVRISAPAGAGIEGI